MYAEFFGFRELPFNNTPDPRFFFATPDHEEGLASLIYTVKERKGFVLLTGEVGTGKTLVTRMMIRHFGANLSFANISHSVRDPVELMESICTEFELESERGTSATQLVRLLHDFLLNQFSRDIPVVLVLDEAQNLPVQAFEQLRMIGNLEADDAKLLQIAIVGQPELQRRFLSPKLRQLRQRIFRSYHLPALTREVSDQYIRHRLSIVTNEGNDVFDAGALSEIYRVSQGLPRIINTVCDNALLSAYSLGRKTIDGPFVESVVSQLMVFSELSPREDAAPSRVPERSEPGSEPVAVSADAQASPPPPRVMPTATRPTPAGAGRPAHDAAPVPTKRAATAQPEPRPAAPRAVFDESRYLAEAETAAARAVTEQWRRSAREYELQVASQNARTAQLIKAMADECDRAQATHASMASVAQSLANATARAEEAARTIEHRDAQLRKVWETGSDLVRMLRLLLERARETTADVVTVERSARKTYGRLCDQIGGAERLTDELNGLSDRILADHRRAARAYVPAASPQTSPAGSTGAAERGITTTDARVTEQAPAQALERKGSAASVSELLRQTRASLSDLRVLAGTGRPTGYVPEPDLAGQADSTTRLAHQVEEILEVIEPRRTDPRPQHVNTGT